MDENIQNQELSETELTRMIEDLCASKAEEFHLIGYPNVQPAEIWACVSSRYGQQLPRLHQIVNDVLTLKTTQFMNWMMKKAYQEAEN